MNVDRSLTQKKATRAMPSGVPMRPTGLVIIDGMASGSTGDVEVRTEGLDHLPDSGWSVMIQVPGRTCAAPVNPRLATANVSRSADARTVRPAPLLPADFDFSGLVSLQASGATLEPQMRDAAEMVTRHSRPPPQGGSTRTAATPRGLGGRRPSVRRADGAALLGGLGGTHRRVA
jgi:hypothetical protein